MKITSFSKKGIYHSQSNTENQDAVCYAEENGACVITLADGVSECSESKRGAETASKALTNLLIDKGSYLLQFEKREIASMTLSHIREELDDHAAHENKTINDYSSTIAGVLFDETKKTLMTLNLGDGMIIAVKKGCCKILSMPSDSSSGCCVTTTNNAENSTIVNVDNNSDWESVIIFSDGAWKLLFERNKLKAEIISMFENQRFDHLKQYMNRQNSFDDSSFIALSINKP